MTRIRMRLKPQAHLRYVGIGPRTHVRYKKAMLKFHRFIMLNGSFPTNMSELDFMAGEFINHLYQEGEPYGYAADFCSALRRFYATCKRHVGTDKLYFSNWKRSYGTLQTKKNVYLCYYNVIYLVNTTIMSHIIFSWFKFTLPINIIP